MKNKLDPVPFSVPSLAIFVRGCGLQVDDTWRKEVRDSSREAEGRYISSVVGKLFLIIEIVARG